MFLTNVQLNITNSYLQNLIQYQYFLFCLARLFFEILFCLAIRDVKSCLGHNNYLILYWETKTI